MRVPLTIGLDNKIFKFDTLTVFRDITQKSIYKNIWGRMGIMNKNIYLDNAATTKMYPEVKEAMLPYMEDKFANSSTSYEEGIENKHVLEKAREKIAGCIGAKAEEIFFTSGGSESDNWAIKCLAGDNKKKGTHIITQKTEHHAVLNSCEYLEKLGYDVTYLDVDRNGIVDMKELKNCTESDTTLITIMYGNNEIGTIQPINEIGVWARRNGVFFHCDAVAAMGKVPIDVSRMPVDLMSASGHKFHGPKGVGFLYVRKGVHIPSFIHGGAQESGKRAGTENLAGIVGMAKALEMSVNQMHKSMQKEMYLRNYLMERVLGEIENVKYNGSTIYRLPGNASFSFKGVEAVALLVLMEEEGIIASAGSACNTGKSRLSHVISAIKVPEEYAIGTIRFTLGEDTTREDIDWTVESLKRNVKLLRMI